MFKILSLVFLLISCKPPGASVTHVATPSIEKFSEARFRHDTKPEQTNVDFREPLTFSAFLSARNNLNIEDQSLADQAALQRLLSYTVQLVDNGDPYCSGTLIGESGVIMTAAHCVQSDENLNANNYEIITHDGVTHQSKLVVALNKTPPGLEENAECNYFMSVIGGTAGIDRLEYLQAFHDYCLKIQGADIAILKIHVDEASPIQFPAASLCSSPPNGNEAVYSFNYPDSELQTSWGYVYPRRSYLLYGGNAIVTSAFIGAGSSGGSLFNEAGELCGVTNNQIRSEDEVLELFKNSDLSNLHSLSPIGGAATSIPFVKALFNLSCFDKTSCFEHL